MKYVSLTLLCALSIGCTSTQTSSNNSDLSQEIAAKKSEISKCLKASDDSGDNCVSKESSNKLGFRCKKTMVTGTRLTKKICTTAKQREELAKASREATNGIQNSRRPPPTGEQIWHSGF